jgi:YD repeat-containing protein
MAPRVVAWAAAVLLSSAGFAVAEPLVWLETPTVVVESVLDPARGEICRSEGALVFTLARRASVTLVGPSPVEGRVDGRPTAVISEILLEPGRHVLVLSTALLGDPLGRRELELRVRPPGAVPAEKEAVLVRGDIVNRPVLPVGRYFLRGIDLLDGHLVRQSTDLKLEGRHLALEMTRTYSSSGALPDGATGVGWAFSYGSKLFPAESCGLYTVTTADGSSQTFRSPDGGRSFLPQKGYHTSLQRLPDGSFEFVDKAAHRHHFAGPEPGQGPVRRLLFIEEPHGDRIELRYDHRGRLAEASEVQSGGAGVRVLARSLLVTWATAGGFARIRSVEAVGLGHRADYTYDPNGTLATAAIFDSDTAGSQIERYEYSSDDALRRNPLAAVTDKDGHRTEYRFDGQGLVKEVVDRPPKGGQTSTTFAYDRSRAAEGIHRTTTKAGPATPAVYVLNSAGNPVQIEETDEHGRRTLTLEWAANDVYKLGEKDDRGYEARFGYDVRGNLVSARTRATAGAAAEDVAYEYDPRFNKLVRKRDAKGQISTWRIAPRTGDLLEAREPDGKVTRYAYDRQGNLIEIDGPDGRTRFFDHDTFGNATRVVLPSGKVENREFDLRGRRYPDEGAAPASPAPDPR